MRERQAYQRAEAIWPADLDWYREVKAKALGRYRCALHGSALPAYLPLEAGEARSGGVGVGRGRHRLAK